MEVTPEMRRAVYELDCTAKGHMLAMDAVLPLSDPTPGARTVNDESPHVSCRRCGKVWVIFEEAGNDYDDAIERTRGQLKDPERLRRRSR